MTLRILYRGPLSSCNYGCEYCPFAKRVESRAELDGDRRALERFVAWIARQERPIGVLFTPWGEGLIRPWYQEALVALSTMPHVERVAIQTNLSARLDLLGRCDPARVAFWCTYHPEWTTRAKFLDQLARLDGAGARYSVGVVGFRRFLDEAEALRRALPESVYVWLNAVKGEQAEAYTDEDLARMRAIDPLVDWNLRAHPSRGRRCGAGETAISVDGDGAVRRCHFLREVIGNLYEPGWERALAPRTCPAATCGCHIGYVHLEELGLEAVFGDGILERVPAVPLARLRARRAVGA